MAIPNERPDSNTPQVLLFGHAGAGKSSLLAALVRAGEAQGETLRGDIQEASGRLSAIRDAVYHGTELARTDTELTSYTIRIRPWRVETIAVAGPRTVILHDCSGKAAESLIRHPSSLRDPDPQAPIARAVIEADAIVLLADSTDDDEELREAFEEFDTFLTIVAQGKASAREVGGFPILLVLTKCDELAVAGDTREQWEARVQHRAERAWKEFDAFLKDADPDDGIPSPFLPFGSIDLTVYTVAIREPALVGRSSGTDTPYQVAELFRDCFTAASTHHNRVAESNRQLKWTVRAALALVAALFLGALLVSLFPPQQGDPGLAERVKGYAKHEPEPAIRLAEGYIGTNKRQLASFRDDGAFATLPEELRAFVTDRLHEIEQYEEYRGKLATATSPSDVRTIEELQLVEKSLHSGALSLPKLTWESTPAGQLREKWLSDARAIRAAEAKYLERYQDMVRRGTALLLAGSLAGDWRADTTTMAADSARSPTDLDDALPGSPELELPRGKVVLNRIPYEYDRVYRARNESAATAERLTRMRDLADALGLTAGPNRPEAVLLLPEPGPGTNSATLPAARLFALRNLAQTPDGTHEWKLANFPEPGRGLLAERLDRSLRTGTRHVQAMLTERIGPDMDAKDTPDGWRAVADSLTDPAFADWGRLLVFMLRLRDHSAINPVAELATFLRATKFELDLRGFNLFIPPDLALDKVTPAGPLKVTVTPRGATPITLSFKLDGSGTRDGSGTSYRFVPEGTSKVTYRPGDELRADVPVRSGTQEFKLVWESGATRTFQFDRLSREPRLVKPGGSEAATGVRLTPAIGSGLPRIPALFPELKK